MKRKPEKKSSKKTQSTKKVRLARYIAECHAVSRRKAESLIEKGLIKVNGENVTSLSTTVVEGVDKVELRGRILVPQEKGILLFHKPRSVVSTMSDDRGRRCLADYLTKRYCTYFPVGRLDWDSTGLIVLTNDGEIANRLLHPRYGHQKTYEVRVEGFITDRAIDTLERGVKLSDGIVRAGVTVLSREHDTSWISVTISMGRNRVIRRVMEKLGFPVLKLKRIQQGPFRLGSLKPGQMRALPQDQYARQRSAILAVSKEAAPG